MHITVNRLELIQFINTEIDRLNQTISNLEHLIEMRIKDDREKALDNKTAIKMYVQSRCDSIISQDKQARIDYCNSHLLFGFIPYGSANIPELRRKEDLWPVEEQRLMEWIHSHYAHCLAHLQRNYGDIFDERPKQWWQSKSYYHHSKKYRLTRNRRDALKRMLDLLQQVVHGDVVTLEEHDLKLIYTDSI